MCVAMLCGQRYDPQTPDQEADDREQRHPDERRQPNGYPDPQDPSEFTEIEARKRSPCPRGPAPPEARLPEVAEPRQDEYGAEFEPHDRGRGPSAPLSAELRRAQLPVDQGVVEACVQREGKAGDHHRTDRASHAFRRVTQHDVADSRRHAGRRGAQIPVAHVGRFRVDTEQREQGLRIEQHEDP